MSSKLMTRWGIWVAATCVIAAGVAGRSVALGEDRAPAAAERKASKPTNWAEECQRLKREIRGLDQRIESLRRDIAARSALLADAKKGHAERQAKQQEIREALVAGRELLLDDRCTIKIGCKTYSKAEFAVALQRLLADFQSNARELNEQCDLLAQHQSAYDTAVTRLGESLAARELAASALRQHEAAQAKVTAAVAVVVAQTPAPAARQHQPEADSALQSVVAEVDRVLAEKKTDKK